jgi:uncharacterized protein YqgQ
MESFYNSLQPGDLIYVRAVATMPSPLQNRLALCRILKIKRDESQPDYIEYICEIVQQWFPDYGPIRWFGKRLTVGCNIGFIHSGMWHLYSVEEFESSHDTVRERRIAREKLRKKRKSIKHKAVKGMIALAALSVILYVLFSVLRSCGA